MIHFTRWNNMLNVEASEFEFKAMIGHKVENILEMGYSMNERREAN